MELLIKKNSPEDVGSISTDALLENFVDKEFIAGMEESIKEELKNAREDEQKNNSFFIQELLTLSNKLIQLEKELVSGMERSKEIQESINMFITSYKEDIDAIRNNTVSKQGFEDEIKALDAKAVACMEKIDSEKKEIVDRIQGIVDFSEFKLDSVRNDITELSGEVKSEIKAYQSLFSQSISPIQENLQSLQSQLLQVKNLAENLEANLANTSGKLFNAVTASEAKVALDFAKLLQNIREAMPKSNVEGVNTVFTNPLLMRVDTNLMLEEGSVPVDSFFVKDGKLLIKTANGWKTIQ